MPSEELTNKLARPASRRTVVKTGAKLAYAAPLVAATMKLSAHGASASVSGPAAGITVCRSVSDNNGENTRQLVANQDYRVTHVPGGESAVFNSLASGYIEVYVYDCHGDPGQNMYINEDAGGYTQITFFSYLQGNPVGNCVQGGGCFTVEAV
jgi:hypothetical protein